MRQGGTVGSTRREWSLDRCGGLSSPGGEVSIAASASVAFDTPEDLARDADVYKDRVRGRQRLPDRSRAYGSLPHE